MQNIAIFCGSKYGNDAAIAATVKELGALLGKHKKHVIYGGGKAGLMGLIADTTMANGGTVTGIIPEFLNDVERQNKDITELIVTKNMHDRKQLLFGKADAAIILPGGFGTLDELFELLTWNQLELHQIKVFILNINGFYGFILEHIKKMETENFLYGNEYTRIIELKQSSDIMPHL